MCYGVKIIFLRHIIVKFVKDIVAIMSMMKLKGFDFQNSA